MTDTQNGPKESAGSKVWWAVISGIAGTVGAAIGAAIVWMTVSLGDLVTVDGIRDAIGDSEELQVKIAKRASGPVATLLLDDQHNTAFRDVLADDTGDENGTSRFKGPRGAKGQPGAPVGSIVAWPTDIPPEGTTWAESDWRKCNGDSLNSDDYPKLVAALGGEESPYGWEGGKIKLPDFLGCFLRGKGEASLLPGDNRNAKYEAGEFGVRQSDLHTMAKPMSGDSLKGGQDFQLWINDPAPGREETRPVNYAVHWIIRVR